MADALAHPRPYTGEGASGKRVPPLGGGGGVDSNSPREASPQKAEDRKKVPCPLITFWGGGKNKKYPKLWGFSI